MIKFYNFLTRKKEIFRPLRKDWVGLYTCGPTVYNYAHIGNLRTYIFEDILRRTLEYAGYRIRHVMNITDVEDKIIRDAKKAGKTIFDFVKPYEKAFFEDLEKLNIEKAWKYPQATEHIPEMVKLIRKLIQKGLAYEIDGSVYFSISKFGPYGKLSRVKARELKSGARVDVDEYEKENAQDFVLWKESKAGEPVWDTPIGKGRPGWHLECSAMSMKYLGETFDIHAGGVDLIFPHHENEIAQSEGSTGKPFVRFFAEGEHLLVHGERMAKSLGNILTIRDIEKRGFNPLAFRYLMLTTHYRSKLNFTWESLEAAQKSLERLYDFDKNLRAGRERSVPASNYYRGLASIVRNRFMKAIFNDLDTPQALAVVWALVNKYNKNPKKYDAKEILRLTFDFDRVLGLGLKEIKPEKVPQKILALVKRREEHREERMWKKADDIRKQLEKSGWVIEDTTEGPKVKKNYARH